MDLIGAYSRQAWLSDRLDALKDRLTSTPLRDVSHTPSARPHQRKYKQRLTQAIRDEIVAKYNAGATSTQLVREFHLGKGTVLKILHEGGAAMRNQGLNPAQVAQAAHLYESGQSLAQIGTYFNVDPGTVHDALRKRGVRMRDTHGRER
ncbi:helix-turn-helix domain-containing protein [Nocardia asteroides]|uniref:helix-turn-helix domain-containing protein n=1 Tax=Nocardia asteroides TaxID=1824 RepID=UPI001E46562B|nr:hypothetical protein [Nocardia asteroides]UGT64410.1 hypothetical protein LTT61_14465 [Nocardia asteroides]